MKNFFYTLYIMIPKIRGKYRDIDELLSNLKWKLLRKKKNGNKVYSYKLKNIKYE